MIRLLIVDDNEQNLYLLQFLLKGHGYEVTTAANGSEALEIARHDPPDIIITDILMPVMDGFTLCREWKRDERLKEVPFIFYTATYTEPSDEKLALSLGAERFLVKPVKPEVFVEMLQEVIEEQEAGLAAPRQPEEEKQEQEEEEEAYLEEYNKALIRKLEDKLVQLDEANRELEREVTERKQAEEALQEKIRLENVCQKIAQTILSPFDRDEVLDHLGPHIINVGIFRSLAISLPDYESNSVEVVRVFNRLEDGSIKQGADVGRRYSLNSKDILAETVRTGERQVAVEWDERFNGSHDPDFHRGSVAYFIPVKKGGQVVAVLATGSTIEEKEETLQRIGDIGFLLDQVAIALEHAGLYRTAQEEITERKQAEEELSYRFRVEKMANEIASSFVNAESTEIDETVTSALENIARFTGANRSSLFLLSDDLETITNTHEWCTSPEDSQIALLQDIPFSTFGYHREELLQHRAISISSIEDIPLTAKGERAWMEEHGFRSLLFIPLLKQRMLHGTLGFYGAIGDEVTWPSAWNVYVRWESFLPA